jgi:hypothetical protein
MRAIRALAVVAALVGLDVSVAAAQPTRGFTDSWFWGFKSGVTTYSVYAGENGAARDVNQIALSFGADWLITRDKGGLYVAYDHALVNGSLVVNDSVHPEDSCPTVDRPTCRRVDIEGMHRLTLAGTIFPLQTRFVQPYVGFGVAFSHIASADADTVEYSQVFGVPYRNPLQRDLVIQTIQQFRTTASPILLLGTQLKLPLISVFGHVTATTANQNFLLSAPGGAGWRVSLEAGARYNVGSSIDRMR